MFVCSLVMCKSVPMGFLLLYVILTGDVVLINTYAPALTYINCYCAQIEKQYSQLYF